MRAEMGHILHTHTHAAKLVVRMSRLYLAIDSGGNMYADSFCAIIATWLNTFQKSMPMCLVHLHLRTECN